jgi:non-specific serine/threonine protein kinase
LTGEPAWSALPLDTPVGVRRLLEQCLEKEPDRRPADARILRERILGLTRMGTSPERAAAPEPAHNLPADLTRFIGRKSEVDACASLLGTSRLLTLTGIGGAGKTRLALRLARECLHRFPDGVWLVDLSVVSDPDRVGLTAATALGVPEAGGRSIEEVLAEHLGSRCALLVLDNCEHVRNACTALARALLGAAPHVRLVATSREALGVAGEQIYALPPLGLPTEPSPGTFDEGALSDAERLFADRATLVAPTFSITSENAADVRDICRTLDGIPLAIELAAARLNVLSTSELRERLDDRFRLLTRGATLAPRHQALRETIQWSYDHLSPAERRLLRRMSVFVGGWTLRAATAVAADGMDEFGVLNLLSRLSEQSLLLSTRHERVESRYRMLETVRQFSIERLKEEGEERAASERHLDYFVEWTEEARPHLSGTADEAWLARIDLERENVLAAHAACDGIPGGAERGLRLLWAIRLYWGKRGLVGLGLRQGLAALGRSGAADAAGSAPWRSDLLFTTAWLAYFHGRYEEAEALADESLACCRDRGDRFGAANALAWMGAVSLARGALDPARARLDEAVALAREPGNRPILAPALHNFGSLKLLEGDAAAAVSCFSEALALSREGGRLEGVVVNLLALARVEIGRGRLDEARERLVEGLRLAEEHSMRVRGQALLDESAAWAAVRGAHALAARLWGAAEAARRSMGLSREPTDEAFLAPRIGRARDTLGAEAFAWEEGVGAALPFEEALSQSRAGLERGASP